MLTLFYFWQPEIFAVIVEMEKFTKDGKEQDSDEDEVEDVEPVSTPQPGFSFIHVFKSNTWWRKFFNFFDQ